MSYCRQRKAQEILAKVQRSKSIWIHYVKSSNGSLLKFLEIHCKDIKGSDMSSILLNKMLEDSKIDPRVARNALVRLVKDRRLAKAHDDALDTLCRIANSVGEKDPYNNPGYWLKTYF